MLEIMMLDFTTSRSKKYSHNTILIFVLLQTQSIFFTIRIQQHKPNLMRFYKSFNISSSDFLKFKGIPFVTVNSMAMEKDGCTICKEAERKILDIAGK